MARNSTNTVSPRRIVAGVFVFVGLFVMCYGLGNRSQALMVTGAAVMVLSFSVRLFSTFRRPAREWIIGTGHVLEASEPPPDARFGRCTMQLVVDAPGLPGETVHHNDSRVPVAHWPYPGLDLPIEVAADDPSTVRVRWRQVPRREFSYEEFGAPFGPEGYQREAPAAPGEPVAEPHEAYIDFDIDHPPDHPPGAPAGREAGPRPVVAPLPPELGDLAPAGEPELAVGPPADLPRPRRRPRPRPHPAPPSAGEPGTGDEPAAMAQLEADREPAQEPDPEREPAPQPEPVLAGAGVPAMAGAASGTGSGRSSVDDLVTTYPSAHPGPAGAINNVGITVLVADLYRSIAFYRDQLGFYEVDGGDGNTVLASGETRLVLRAAPDLGKIKRRSVYLNLEVSDIDAVYTELKTNGVRFTNPPRPVNRTARLELWAATFRDPDGHGIALTQWRPAPPSAG